MSQLTPLPLLRSGLLLSLLFSIPSTAAHAQAASRVQEALPPGDYTVITKPYMGSGYESLPVMVTSVTTEVALNGGVSIVAVNNGTEGRLEAIRLSWYLSPREAPDYILLQGETPLLRLPGGIAAGEVERIKYPVVSFAKIWKPLVRKGVVKGNYVIQVGVSECLLDDGTVQTFLPRGKTKAGTKR